MNLSCADMARAYLHQLSPDPSEEKVRSLTALLERVVAEERNACALIAEETMRLYGSHAAEQVAVKIRSRGEASP